MYILWHVYAPVKEHLISIYSDYYLRALGLTQPLIGVPGSYVLGGGSLQAICRFGRKRTQQFLIFFHVL